MSDKTPVSMAGSYQEIGEFWDNHDSADFGEQAEVEFKVDIESQPKYYSLDKILALKLGRLAKAHGVSEETLLNLWVQEKLNQLG
ncbi:hypothetical protein [Methylomagnum sp.]